MPAKTDPTFLDTAYIYALINTRDEWHEEALKWQERLEEERRRIITTELKLIEIADGLASVRFRNQATQIITTLKSSPCVEVIAMSSGLFAEAFSLYRERGDKEGGMTDCVSFVVMSTRGLVEALTGDDHFKQAGFRPLLREPAL